MLSCKSVNLTDAKILYTSLFNAALPVEVLIIYRVAYTVYTSLFSAGLPVNCVLNDIIKSYSHAR